jgi:hypothetical protein
MRRAQVATRAMAAGGTDPDPELEEIEAVVPARAVLTELARGFLLVQSSNPEHAVRFAAGFLKEQTGHVELGRIEPVQKVSLARLSLGRGNRGAIEPRGLPPAP